MSKLDKIKEAFTEVIRITDRKHDAWDKAKQALKDLEELRDSKSKAKMFFEEDRGLSSASSGTPMPTVKAPTPEGASKAYNDALRESAYLLPQSPKGE